MIKEPLNRSIVFLKGFISILISPTAGGALARKLILAAILIPPTVNWFSHYGVKTGLYTDETAVLIRAIGSATFLIFIIIKAVSELNRTDIARSISSQEKRRLEVKLNNEIIEHQNRYKAIIANSSAIIWSVDLSGIFTFSEGDTLKLIGIEPGSRIGKSIYEIYKNEPAVLQAIHRALRGEPSSGELKVADRWFQVHYSPSRNIQGIINSVVGVSVDITLKKKSEEMKRAKEEAEANTKAKSIFLANMSHEVRTPINGILGMVWLLLETDLKEDQRKFANNIKNSADSLLRVVNDILDFSKVEAGKIEFEKQVFAISETVAQAIDRLQYVANARGLYLRYKVDPNVPEFAVGDPGRIQQILINLVNNAIKFTSHGGIDVLVNLEKSNDKNFTLRCSITDTGIGIPESAQKKIFESFQQADSSTTRRFGGTGLGLSICKKLSELMGGTIGFETKESKGSTFWFTINVGRANMTPQLLSNEKNLEDIIELFSSSLEVLVVEDNEVNQMVSTKMLEYLGHGVTVANNGIDALKKLEQNKYDLILMDCQMPEMDGYEATRRIRLSDDNVLKTTPIIAVTSNAIEGSREACLEAGMNDYISKPLKIEELAECIQRTISA